MASFNKFNSFVEAEAEKVHNLGSDTLKVALTNSAPVATNTVLANITQITGGGTTGYTTGGTAVTVTTSAQTSGTYTLDGNDVVFTAGADTMGPFRYAVLYNDTPASSPVDPLIGWWDYGSSITLQDGETFTVQFGGSGILTKA